jgi:hypothetical protein
LFSLVAIWVMHLRLKRAVRARTTGFVDAKALVLWRQRTLLNISLWRDVPSIATMGRVPGHVNAARLPSRLGVATAGCVYPSAGDWREVLFGIDVATRSPLAPLKPRDADDKQGVQA